MKNVRTNKPLSLAMKVISVTAFVMGMMFLFRLTITSGQDTEQQVEKESYSAINSILTW
jgi:hypothetical protein